MKKFIFIISIAGLLSLTATSQQRFNSLDSLLSYATRNSVSAKISSQQTLLAKWTKISAIVNGVNFRNPLSFSATNNLQLPVNFIPADAFGGPAGTYRQITLGQQYVSNFNFNPQIDIINPANLAKIKSADINKELTEVNNQLVKKSLFESIAAAWSNVMGLQEQIKVTEQSVTSSDSLVFILRNKFEAGIARQQDLNNGLINQLNTQDKLQQLKISYSQQINTIKILCDIPVETIVIIDSPPTQNISPLDIKPSGTLQSRYNLLQSSFARAELNSVRYSMLPVVSLAYYQGWQKNSNTGFSDAAAPWIESKFIGLRITMPFPPDVNKMSQSYNNKINHRIAALNAVHSQLQNELGNESLKLDYDKSVASYESALQVEKLKTENYRKGLDQYMEGVLPADLLLTAFNDLLNSRLNLATAAATIEYNKNRIIINNQFK